jgi:hypothetical protein
VRHLAKPTTPSRRFYQSVFCYVLCACMPTNPLSDEGHTKFGALHDRSRTNDGEEERRGCLSR